MVLHTGLRPLGYDSQPSPPLPSRRQSQQGPLAACPLGWVSEARRQALPHISPKNTHPEAPGLGPEPVLTSQGHLSWSQGKGSKRQSTPHAPPPGRRGGTGPGGRFQSRERVAGIGQKNLGSSTPLLGSTASTQPPPSSLTR